MNSNIPKEFDDWWDSDWRADCPVPNIRKDSPMWWAYQGWMAGAKAEREACAQIAETAFPFHCEDLIRARGKQNGTMD